MQAKRGNVKFQLPRPWLELLALYQLLAKLSAVMVLLAVAILVLIVRLQLELELALLSQQIP
jgi:hypothetical protein